MQDDKLQNSYTRLDEIETDRKQILQRMLNDNSYTMEEYDQDISLLKLKREYLQERINTLLLISTNLSMIKKYPKKENFYKAVKNSDNWKIFSDNLKDYQWMTFEGEICDTCGRTESSTTHIAAAILPSGALEIICNHCFEKELKTTTTNSGGTNATS